MRVAWVASARTGKQAVSAGAWLALKPWVGLSHPLCRCRAETAVAGRVCKHCRLEELFWGWEVRRMAACSLGLPLHG